WHALRAGVDRDSRRPARPVAEDARGGRVAGNRVATQAGLHPAWRHQRGAPGRHRARNGVAVTALSGGVFDTGTADDDGAELRQLVDDIGRRSFDAKLGMRRVPEPFDAALWRNL